MIRFFLYPMGSTDPVIFKLQLKCCFLPGIFSGGAKSIVMQISFVFRPSFREGQKFPGGQTDSGGAPLWKKATLYGNDFPGQPIHLLRNKTALEARGVRQFVLLGIENEA